MPWAPAPNPRQPAARARGMPEARFIPKRRPCLPPRSQQQEGIPRARRFSSPALPPASPDVVCRGREFDSDALLVCIASLALCYLRKQVSETTTPALRCNLPWPSTTEATRKPPTCRFDDTHHTTSTLQRHRSSYSGVATTTSSRASLQYSLHHLPVLPTLSPTPPPAPLRPPGLRLRRFRVATCGLGCNEMNSRFKLP